MTEGSELSLPPLKAKPPAQRHRLRRVNQRSRAKERNSVILSRVDVAGDVAAINEGQARRAGDIYVVNGRRYQLEPSGTLAPVDGDGIYPLNRAEYRALGVYNVFGLTARAEEILDLMGFIGTEHRTAARQVILTERGNR